MARPAVFRLQKSERPSGTFYTAIKGKLDPVTIWLGALDPADADRCLQALRDEDEAGNVDRVLELAKVEHATLGGRKVPGREVLVMHLLSGTGDVLREVLGPPPADYPRMTIAEYYDAVYKDERKKTHPRSWRGEEAEWKRLLASPFARTRLKDVNRAGLYAWLNGLTKLDGSPATWNMKRKQRNLLRWLFSLAMDRGDFPGPMPDFPRLKGSTERTYDEPEPLTEAEVVRLIEATEDPKHRALFAMCFGLGMRPSEAVSMRWEDVDWEFEPPTGLYTGTIYVRGPASADGTRRTKTQKSRALVPMLAIGRRELRSWWEASGKPEAGIVFPARGGKPYAVEGNRATFKSALRTSAIRAGLLDADGKGRRIFPYLGRHTTGTRLIEAGVPVDTVAKLLRHSNPNMLRKHYDHTGAVHSPGLELVPAYRAPEPKAESVGADGGAPELTEEDGPSWVDLTR